MKKIISTIVVVMMICILVSCDESKTGGLGNIPDYLQVRLKVVDNKPVSMEDDIKFYWKDRMIEEYTTSSFRMNFKKELMGFKKEAVKSAKVLVDAKKDEWKLGSNPDYYVYGTIGEWVVLLVPVRTKKINDENLAEVAVCKVNTDNLITYRKLRFYVSYNPFTFDGLISGKKPSTDSLEKLPIRVTDIDNDNILEIACYGIKSVDNKMLHWQYFELDSRPEKINLVHTPSKPIFNKTTGKYYIVENISEKWKEHEYSLPHIVELKEGKLTDVSYLFPETIKTLIIEQERLRFEEPVVKFLYSRIVGTWAEQVHKFASENLVADYSNPLLVQDGYRTENIIDLLSDTTDNTSRVTDKIEEETKDQSDESNDELNEDERLINNIFVCTSREEAWKEFEKPYKKNGIVTLHDVTRIWFGEPFEESHWTEELTGNEIEFEIEDNSYWPERKLGKFVTTELKKGADGFSTAGEENFPLIVYRYIQASFDGSYYYSLCLDRPYDPPEPNEFAMLPLSKDYWIVYIGYDGVLRDGGSQYSIIEFEDIEPRGGYPQVNLFQILDWQKGRPFLEYTNICGIIDVNFDNIPDFVVQNFGLPAGHRACETNIYSIIGGELVSHEFNIGGLGQVEIFYGMKDGYPHFGSFELGINAFDFKLYTCEAAMRYSCVHVLEPREDGFIYDVTYLYPTEEHVEALASLKDSTSGIWFRTLTHLESLGLTRAGQKKFLEITEGETLSENDEISNNIIRDCMKIDKPFHVQSTEDIPEGWEINHVYR